MLTAITFSDIMRDNMIVNVSGLSGHFMAVDLNIEHLIGYLKVREGLYLIGIKHDDTF
jgi:hypothetical protein